MKTNYDLPVQELAEEFRNKFRNFTDVYFKEEDSTSSAIIHVEGLLEVCPKIDIINYGMDEEPNPIYTKLSECLTILKSKG